MQTFPPSDDANLIASDLERFYLDDKRRFWQVSPACGARATDKFRSPPSNASPSHHSSRMILRLPSLRFLCAVAVLAFGALGAARAQTAAPVAFAARLDTAGRDTRLTFALTDCVRVQAYVLDAPARVILDLSEVNFQIDPPAQSPAPRHGHAKPAAQGLALSYRFGRLAAGKSRVVVDLAGPAEILSATCRPFDKTGGELSLVLGRQSEAAFRAAAKAGALQQAQAASAAEYAASAAEQAEISTAPPAARPGAKPIIMLDPGHGGIDAGAHGPQQAVEKTVVLEFARVLATKLRESGKYQVVLTRDDDIFVPLNERVRLARKAGADLFLSLHADALASEAESVQGATIYTVSDRASDAEAARIAEHENKADSAAGLESREDAGDVNDILFDLTRRETRAYSHIFAHSLVDYWKVAARLNKNPRRSAGFVVLKAPDVPSVLLELGYLSNRADEAELLSPAWRDKAAAQVAKAVDGFFAARDAPPSAPKTP